ncbi:hypothetical protein BO443_140108 [Burkholderia orbicola]
MRLHSGRRCQMGTNRVFLLSLPLRSDPSHTGSKKHEFDDKARFQGTRGLVSDYGGQRR